MEKTDKWEGYEVRCAVKGGRRECAFQAGDGGQWRANASLTNGRHNNSARNGKMPSIYLAKVFFIFRKGTKAKQNRKDTLAFIESEAKINIARKGRDSHR